MIRLRAWLALGLLLSLAGCAGADRRMAARSSRGWAPPVGPGAVAGRRAPAEAPARAGRPDLLASAGRPVGGVGRYFPGLANRGPEFVMPDRQPAAARSAASRGDESGEDVTGPDRSRSSLARRQGVSTLPIALNAETYADAEPAPTRRAPGAAIASAPRPDPRDEDARRVEAESAPEAIPPVAEADPASALAETGPVPDEGRDESEDAPPIVEPGSEVARHEAEAEPEAVAVAPPPVAEAGPGSPRVRVERPTDPDASSPALAGRPRMPLVRPTGLPAELPPPSFPPTYYGPDDRRPRPDQARRDAVIPTPRRRWRLGLLDRLRSAMKGADDDSARPEPGDVAQRR